MLFSVNTSLLFPFSTKCFGELDHKETIKLSRQAVKRCVQLWERLMWPLDICLCGTTQKCFFPIAQVVRFFVLSQDNIQFQWEKDIHLFIIKFLGSVWARKIKSTNIKAEVINLSLLLSWGIFSCHLLLWKHTNRLAFIPVWHARLNSDETDTQVV